MRVLLKYPNVCSSLASKNRSGKASYAERRTKIATQSECWNCVRICSYLRFDTLSFYQNMDSSCCHLSTFMFRTILQCISAVYLSNIFSYNLNPGRDLRFTEISEVHSAAPTVSAFRLDYFRTGRVK